MKFEFRLQTLLDHYQEEEKKARQELARRFQQQEEAARTLEFLYADYDALQEFQRQHQRNKLDLFFLACTENYRAGLERRIEVAKGQLARADESVKEQRRVVKEAARNRRVLEKLREKAWKEFCREQKRAEQKVNDELGLYGYIRQTTGRKVVKEL